MKRVTQEKKKKRRDEWKGRRTSSHTFDSIHLITVSGTKQNIKETRYPNAENSKYLKNIL